MHPTLNIAIKAARKAGDIILRYHNQIDLLTIENKAANDFVSEVDKAAEDAIIDELKYAFPDHCILGEENGEILGNSRFQWIVDPLDGTTNYLHGFPQYCVSIALYEDKEATHAVVYDPFKEEMFTASKGQGAYLNEQRIRTTHTRGFENTLIGTGFPFKAPRHLDAYLDMFKAIHPQVAGIRRAGSAALDLAYLAAGRLDGFWEIELSIWDIAAGALLVKEAGGFIGDFSGRDKFLETGNVVAGNEKVFKEILKTIHPHLTSDLQY
ncbi:inositol monophosphatase family protein [bacterium endosymbiont of Bathymodiolus sp. 5 South]|jgi:myo-inositol-1(or 4)-monophosphatase|uniref:inositol monophosphatase family protein n=1 Tax=bacterium endosymbiont of Bathymodiolus sp. 5 South TaxID=1181670 RepID=UPI0010B675B7|nr:inositol monophosphatase family protein [bacterium endosymbiont of Bathymodiolus sp. 5 South]CAC9435102.1 Inositol-1-monophosphatase (EC 3.1.3.25) [uncultured Gammaproteobacteria bacterium]CAC9645148.1 Inositol-1-monophosphatase (EC 3.1.3.25) [uncultured Gammaproteobacteria bacterium]CAC9653415.1 Inositol-1-monophosphatase (EC 3.1.3.25) [uncultured Gammaproteobacteria bacterium]CAC9656446.1 Inositol-1-monophosphatase (EC 3.1.3.25) [uncultured Gammaproteobacteria bacterium]SHN90927.1 Inosito